MITKIPKCTFINVIFNKQKCSTILYEGHLKILETRKRNIFDRRKETTLLLLQIFLFNFYLLLYSKKSVIEAFIPIWSGDFRNIWCWKARNLFLTRGIRKSLGDKSHEYELINSMLFSFKKSTVLRAVCEQPLLWWQ